MIRGLKLFCVGAGTLCVAAFASGQSVNVILTGEAENPPVTTDGSGSAVVTYDTTTREVSISGSYTDMSSNVTMAHLHGLADEDTNAGILFGLTVDGGLSGNFSGSDILSESDFEGFLSNLTYINVHTVNNGPGEIRGQVVIPEPTSALLGGLAVSGLLMRRRRS